MWLVNPYLAMAGTGGGADVTPTAVNWGNITITDTATGVENNLGSVQTLAAIDAQISVKAAWTSTSSSPAKGRWYKNGSASGERSVTPNTVNAALGDTLYFELSARNSASAGNYDSGTVTVTNESDGGAGLDTFTFEVQYIYDLL